MAETLRGALYAAAGHAWKVDLLEEASQVGGGSLPGEDLPTTCVRITPLAGETAEGTAAALRENDPPIFARMKEGAVLLDPRTLEAEEIDAIGEAAGRIARKATY